MKKILVFIISIIALVLCFSVVSSAADIIHTGTWGELSWELNEATGTLTVTGEGDMDDFAKNSTSAWREYRLLVKSIEIDQNITSIGDRAFSGFLNLKGVVIADSVTNIGIGAFSGCENIVSITIPENVEVVGHSCFYGCTGLKTVEMPSTLIEIGELAFFHCHSLDNVVIPSNLTTINFGAFNNCGSLKNIYIHSEGIAKDVTVFGSSNEYVVNFYVLKGLEVSDYIKDTYIYVENKSVNGNEYIRYSSHGHVYDNDCDESCNGCTETRTPAEHIYDDTCDKTCNECGATRDIAHSYENACDGECNVCKTTRMPADHVYENACDSECNVCKATRTPADHVYDNACDTRCNVCIAKRTIEHTYDNNCDVDCNVCNEERTPTDHVWGEPELTTEPTLFKEGENTYTCDECGATRTEPTKSKLGCGGTEGITAAFISGGGISLVWFALKRKKI